MNDKLRIAIKTTCFASGLFTLLYCAWLFQKHAPEIIGWIDELGWLAPVLFLLIYCVATLLLLPTMVLTLAGGALFGPVVGTVLNLFGATTGAAFAFLITRHLMYEWFLTQRGEKINKLIEGVDRKGWVFVAFLRLIPIIPFNLVNYGLGITGIRFRLYLLTTFVFLIPAEIVYTYFGYAGMDALSNGHAYRNGGLLLSFVAIVALCVIQFIKRKKRR